MQFIHQKFDVRFQYPVHFTESLFDPANSLLAEVMQQGEGAGPRKAVFVLDEGLCRAWPRLPEAIQAYCKSYSDKVALAHPLLLVPGGESVKNDHCHVEAVQRMINDAGICRHSYVVAVGGGAVLDMVGFAAAAAHRGVRLIRIPTTVLAQDDSAVGVKNSVNAFGKKNFLGAFAPPHAVINDSDFLTTLSDRDWRCGISEAVKVALIKDADFFGSIESDAAALASRDIAAMKPLIYRCAQLHLNHIADGGDAFELGSSRPLDFGHWAAHKLEQLTDFALRHGEAVAIGIALDTTYSYLTGRLPESDWRRIIDLLRSLGFALYSPAMDACLDDPQGSHGLLSGLDEFQEHLGGQLTIMLLERIGKGIEVHEIAPEIMIESIARLRNIHCAHAEAAPISGGRTYAA